MESVSSFLNVVGESLDLTVSGHCKNIGNYIKVDNIQIQLFMLTIMSAICLHVFLYIFPYVLWLLAFNLTLKNYEQMPTWALFVSLLLILTHYGSPCFPFGVIYIGKSLNKPVNIAWYNYLGSFVPTFLRINSNRK